MFLSRPATRVSTPVTPFCRASSFFCASVTAAWRSASCACAAAMASSARSTLALASSSSCRRSANALAVEVSADLFLAWIAASYSKRAASAFALLPFQAESAT